MSSVPTTPREMLTAGYECLRGYALGGGRSAHPVPGWAALMRGGMVAWLKACPALVPPPPRLPVREPWSIAPVHAAEEVTRVWADMVLGHLPSHAEAKS